MKHIVLLICVISTLSSCVIYKPHDNVDFDRIDTIKQLEGVYLNLGEGGEGSITTYLSRLIWPDSGDMDHKAVQTIDVRAINDTTFIVKALGNNGILRESIFVEGKDFELHFGRIRLKRELAIAGLKPGEPILGWVYDNTELGIDQRGSGKYRGQATVAGLAYLLIPLVAGHNEEIRFEKVTP